MMFSGFGMGTGWFLILVAIVLPALVLLVGLVAAQLGRGNNAPAPTESDAERVLADRLARGEIDADEFERRLHVLRSARH